MNNETRVGDLVPDVVSEFGRFLRSSGTNSELLTEALLSAITVPSPLSEAIERSLRDGYTVVLTGSAGSGKTHLIRSLRASGLLDNVFVCEDLASVPKSDWGSIGQFEQQSLLAANEGALIAASRSFSDARFGELVQRLHWMQLGGVSPEAEENGSGIVLVDAAALDPASNGILTRLLDLQIIFEYAEQRLPRSQLLAWRLLKYPNIRERLSELVEFASSYAEGNGFTFRQIWQFIADLLSAESDENWCGRVFYGETAISRAIRAAFPLESFPLPRVAARLYYYDFDALAGEIPEEGLDYLYEIGVAEPGGLNEVAKHSVRALALLALHDSPIRFRLHAHKDLWGRMYHDSETAPLLHAINNYLTYGLLNLGEDLELWVQLDTERRTVKPDAQVSVGRASFDHFAVKRNRVLDSIEVAADVPLGTRLSLLHEPTGAALQLTRDLITALSGVRSHRSRDREAVEHDWRLHRFIAQVARLEGTSRRLSVAAWDFENRRSQFRRLQLGESQITRE